MKIANKVNELNKTIDVHKHEYKLMCSTINKLKQENKELKQNIKKNYVAKSIFKSLKIVIGDIITEGITKEAWGKKQADKRILLTDIEVKIFETVDLAKENEQAMGVFNI